MFIINRTTNTEDNGIFIPKLTLKQTRRNTSPESSIFPLIWAKFDEIKDSAFLYQNPKVFLFIYKRKK